MGVWRKSCLRINEEEAMEDTCLVWEEEGSGVRDAEAGKQEGEVEWMRVGEQANLRTPDTP